MDIVKTAISLLAAMATVVFAGEVSANDGVPENDYSAFKGKIRKTSKDTSAIRVWFEARLKPLADVDGMFTPEYREFFHEVGEYNWQGTITEEQLRKKWSHRFDVDRSPGDQAFETGNCGWETRKLTEFKYLGELNGGDWFWLTIRGGCQPNDYSGKVERVVKVVQSNGRYQVANLIVPR